MLEDMSWSYYTGTDTKGDEWESRNINMHVRVDEVVKGAPAAGRHIFPRTRIDIRDERGQGVMRDIAEALRLAPKELPSGKKSLISAVLPTFVPAEAENQFDGGVVEGTKDRRIRIRVWQGKPRTDKATDKKLPGYFNYEYSVLPDDED